MGVFFGWIILSLLVGLLGSSRKIGFGFALLWSLLLSPLIGFIITIISPSLKDEEYKETIIKQTEKQAEALSKMNEGSAIQQLKDAKELLDSGAINQEEFDRLKKKLLAEPQIPPKVQPDTKSLPTGSLYKRTLSAASLPRAREALEAGDIEEAIRITRAVMSDSLTYSKHREAEALLEEIKAKQLQQDLLKAQRGSFF